jgi:hypothetical protein
VSAQKVAAGERKRYEEALKRHIKACLPCYRWSTGRAGHQLCDIGMQLTEGITLMERQAELLAPHVEYIQDALW